MGIRLSKVADFAPSFSPSIVPFYAAHLCRPHDCEASLFLQRCAPGTEAQIKQLDICCLCFYPKSALVTFYECKRKSVSGDALYRFGFRLPLDRITESCSSRAVASLVSPQGLPQPRARLLYVALPSNVLRAVQERRRPNLCPLARLLYLRHQRPPAQREEDLHERRA
jgi:hypothetical protein